MRSVFASSAGTPSRRWHLSELILNGLLIVLLSPLFFFFARYALQDATARVATIPTPPLAVWLKRRILTAVSNLTEEERCGCRV